MATPDEQVHVTALDALVFLDELALLAVLAIAGAGLDAALAARIGAAVGLVVVVGAVWGRWLAPRASRRVTHPTRLVVKLALFAGASVLLGITGRPVAAVAFLVTSGVIVTAGEWRDARRGA